MSDSVRDSDCICAGADNSLIASQLLAQIATRLCAAKLTTETGGVISIGCTSKNWLIYRYVGAQSSDSAQKGGCDKIVAKGLAGQCPRSRRQVERLGEC